jgi:DNA-binding transcriptional ArsR family regulator
MEKCHSCHHTVAPEDRFCKNCGLPLAEMPRGPLQTPSPSSAEEIACLRRSIYPFLKAGLLFSGGLFVVVLIITKILDALSCEELCVCDISAILGMSPSAVSHHLRTLRNLQLVRHRRAGKKIYYTLRDSHVSVLLAQGLACIACVGETLQEREAGADIRRARAAGASGPHTAP